MRPHLTPKLTVGDDRNIHVQSMEPNFKHRHGLGAVELKGSNGKGEGHGLTLLGLQSRFEDNLLYSEFEWFVP